MRVFLRSTLRISNWTLQNRRDYYIFLHSFGLPRTKPPVTWGPMIFRSSTPLKNIMGPKNHSILRRNIILSKPPFLGVQFLWFCPCHFVLPKLPDSVPRDASRHLTYEAQLFWKREHVQQVGVVLLMKGGGNFKYFVNVHPAKLGKMISIFDEHIFLDGLVQPPTSCWWIASM